MMKMKMKCDRFCFNKVFQWPPPELWLVKELCKEIVVPYTPPHYCPRTELQQKYEDYQYKTRPVPFGIPSEHHTLAIQTAPRPHGDTLHNLLDNLDRAGIERWIGPKLLVSDGFEPKIQSSWSMSTTKTPTAGSARTFIRLLQESLRVDPNLEYLTCLQDDIVLSLNALDYISRVKVPIDLSLISWFTYDYNPPTHKLTPSPETHSNPVLACRPTRLFILGQAITIPRWSIESILYCPYVQNWPKVNGCDEIPGWVLGDAPHAVHFPNLAQHTDGVNSACLLTLNRKDPEAIHPDWIMGHRMSPYFAGLDFNSLKLIQEDHP